jgi:hypothetical protein
MPPLHVLSCGRLRPRQLQSGRTTSTPPLRDALEEPDLLASDVREFFSDLR